MKASVSINMKEKEELLEKTYQDLLEVGFGNSPIEEAPKFMDENVMGYGTALDEKIMSYDEFRELIIVQRTQAENFDEFIYQSNPVIKRIFNQGNSAFMVDEIDLTAVINGDNNKMTVRMTTMFEYNMEAWKVVHWHASKAEHVSDGEDPWHVEEWKKKTEKLEKMVEQKTAELVKKNNELEIEASLERVRAIAMGMKKSDDLLSICEVSYNEFEKLGFPSLRAVLVHIHDDETRSFTDYDYCKLFGGQISTLNYDTHPLVLEFLKQAKSSKDAFAEAVFSGEELESWKKIRLETGQKDDPRLNNLDALYYYGYSIGVGDFTISTLTPIDESQRKILKRFRNVFDLAYRRYNDITLAEAQARESQIEASLERVRAQAMAMHNSEDLALTIDVFSQELKSLNVSLIRCGVGIKEGKSRVVEVTVTSATKNNKEIKIAGKLRLGGHPILDKIYDALQQESEYFPVLRGNEINEYYQAMNPDIEFPNFSEDDIQYGYYFNFREGGLFAWTEKQLPEESLTIFRRFKSVLSLTYRRYLDLKEAEAQAREGQVQLALEKVRLVALGLKKSEEMLEVAKALYEQLVELGFRNIRNAIIDLENGDGDTFTDYDYSHEMSGTITLMSYHDDPTLEGQFKKMATTTDDFFELRLEGKELQNLINLRLKNGEAPDPRLLNTELVTYNLFSFGKGAIGISNFGVLNVEEKVILDRFRNVFTFAYKRYNDLALAEVQAKEARIEAALERVRAKSMAMHKSEELADLSLELVKQVQTLGVSTWFCAFNIYDEDPRGSLEWGSNGQGTFPQYRTPREGIFLRYYETGQRGEALLINKIDEKECPAHYDYLCSLPGVGDQLLKMKEAGIPFPGSQIDHVAYFKYGYIIFITFEPAPEAHDIFKRFAGVFEQTYTRFLDLQKSEEQRKIIQAENNRKTQELEEARKLQLAMLPKELPQLSKLDIAVYMQTATEVGGDYYDFSTKDDGSLNICLGDATGHGLKAGTLVSMIKSLFVSDSVRLGIKEFFVASNETLKKMSLNKMMMAFAMVNIYGNKIKIANAGVPPIYIYRKRMEEVEEIKINGLPIGAMRNSKYEVYDSQLNSGDVIIMLSDGMPELQNENDEMYGYERLIEIFKEHATKTCDEIITVLKTESNRWKGIREPDDDITFVVIKVK